MLEELVITDQEVEFMQRRCPYIPRVFLAVDIGAFGQHGKSLWQGFQRTGQRWPYPAAFAAGYAVARPYSPRRPMAATL